MKKSLVNRRDFLTTAGLAGGALGFSTLGLNCSAEVNATILILPGDPAYDQARQNINHALNFKPAAIAICYTTKDVQYAVNHAVSKGWKMAVRSGAHSYEGFSLIDDGMVIDVSPMCRVFQVSPNKARLGPATHLIDAYTNLAKYMDGMIPGGSCGTVAVAGLTLGGGYGLFSRKYGMTCDHLYRVKMVTYDGTIVDSDNDPSLLWACQGAGGGNFGIVTEMYFNLVPAPKQVTVFKLTWKYTEQIIDVIEAWQYWVLSSIDENMFSIFPCTSTPQNTTFSIAGQYFGTVAETKTIVQKLIDNTPPSIQPNFYAYMPFVSAVRYNDGEPGQSSFKDTSGYTKSALNSNAVKEIYKWLSNAPSANCLLQMDSFGGAINNLSPSATAFPHRNMNFIYQFQAYWDSPDDQKKHEDWVDNFSKEIRTEFMEDACYRNYGDVTLSDWQYKYYANNYAKLQQIKQKYDPKDYFKYSQSIELPS